MKRTLQLVVLLQLVMGTQGMLHAEGQVLDRVVATVNDGVILESEWDDAIRYECFLNRKSPEQLTAVERRATLERLIDQLLLGQQMEATGFTHATADEVNERMRQIHQEIPGGATEAGWKAALARYGLTAEVVADRVARQLDLERYVDQRFRPSVYVDAESVQNYYRSRLVPELERNRNPIPSFEEVRGSIERILAEERVNELLSAWLKTLRTQSQIEVK